jgi:hypothetical protein
LVAVNSTTPSTADQHIFTANLRLGLRYYGEPTERARPLMTLSALVGYQDYGGTQLSLGGAAQAGGAYFFTPHLSLGVAGEISVQRTRDRVGGIESKGVITRFDGFRVLGAVYF